MSHFRALRTIRNIPRLKDITLVLGKHGLHQLATYLGAPIRVRLRPKMWSSYGERLADRAVPGADWLMVRPY